MSIKNKNFTLVITIIVMLVLAGVSLNAIVGDNGILNQAKKATIAQRLASYKEEMEINIVGDGGDLGVVDRLKVTALNDNIKKYIPSLEDRDLGKFGIIAGELYYLGDNEDEIKVAENQNIKTKAPDQSMDDFVEEVEGEAIENMLQNITEGAFTRNR